MDFTSKKNMNTVCEVCGDVGYRQLLIYCGDCKRCAVHQYCLDKVVFDASLIKWFCYECLQRRGEATCISSLEKVSSERPLSHDGSRSPVHQLITNSVESVRDAGPWRNGINEPTDGAYFIDMNGILHESLESKDSGSPSHPLYFLPSSSGLSKSQKKIVEERVQAIKSEVPIYVAIMKRISLGMSRMSWIPELELGLRYATAVNLPTGEQTVVLCCGRNIWKANIVTHRRRYYLSGGWHRFVRDNGLALGDICLFELKRNERELTMMVHIIPSKKL